MVTIEFRSQVLVNTDPQRRCYHGEYFSYEMHWTAWEDLELEIDPDRVETRLEFWRSLNQIAVDARGEDARREFRVKPTTPSVCG